MWSYINTILKNYLGDASASHKETGLRVHYAVRFLKDNYCFTTMQSVPCDFKLWHKAVAALKSL